MRSLTKWEVNFFLEQFDRYENKLFLQMRKDKYPLDKILDFIKGYNTFKKECSTVINIKVVNNGKYQINNCNSYDRDTLLLLIPYVLDNIEYDCNNSWRTIGIKYASCLTKYYIENVIFGDDNEVPDCLYMNIPDKDHPETYDWEAHGLNDDIFKEV